MKQTPAQNAMRICSVIIITGLLCAVDTRASDESAALLLEKGIYTEQTVGDFQKAIEIYQQIVKKSGVDKKHAAQAHYRLALCLMKLGKTSEAQNTFNQLTTQYPDQKAMVDQARRQLAGLNTNTPLVINTTPRALDNRVDPAITKMTVTFNKTMMDGNWSWTGGGDTFPQMTGQPSYDASRTTCSLPVKLQPGKVYVVGINGGKFTNFKTPQQVPATPYLIVFATQTKDGKPTPIPDALVDETRRINSSNQNTGAKNISDADKRDAETLAAEGWRLWGQRQLVEAEAKFKAAVEKDPTASNAWNGLGWSQLNQGKRHNAKQAFNKAVELEPSHPAALNGLGWIAKGEGNTDEAIAHWNKAIKATPNTTAALNGLATTYAELGKYDEAIKIYEKWIRIEPNNSELKKKRKEAESARQVVTEAIAVAQKYLKLIDAGKYDESWEASAALVRQVITKAQWNQQIKPIRSAMGEMVSRTVKSAVYATSLPGAPDGQYVVIKFETVLKNKKQNVETVTPMKEADGKWRVAGYYIR